MLRFLKRLLLSLLALCALLVALYLFRAPVLRGVAGLWIVNDPLDKADAIVVLGGGLETRPFEAARLYHQGLAPKILLTNVRSNDTAYLGITAPETSLARQVLLKKSVPENAVFVINYDVASTHDECLAVRRWVDQNKPKRLIITTDLFHTRRVKWFFDKTLKGTGVEIRVDAVVPLNYNASDWWQHEDGLIGFQNEVVKFGYYLIKY
jgi:uncharacterized SAM-binding protein YcdF (DUF218 family)